MTSIHLCGKLSMRRALGLLTLAFAVATPAAADTHPNLARGFAPDKAFQIGDVDHVNEFNGNLVLTLPIGNAYPVGGDLSYGLTLSHNSNLWNFIERPDTFATYTQAIANVRANSGFGWMLSLGRLESPTFGANDSGRWLYIGPDGSEHPFFDTLHEGEASTSGYWYSRDGSYLRLRDIGAGSHEVEMPNGQIHQFGSDGELTLIRDRFSNWVMLTQLSGGFTWQLNDSQGRTQQVNFVADPILGKRVSTVVLKAFGGTTATYTFGYTAMAVERPCMDNDPTTGNLTVNMLTSVTLPDLSTYSIPEYYLTQASGCGSTGAVKSLVLPTLGKIVWTYQDYLFPNPPGSKLHRSRSTGVATRTLYDAAGIQVGQWQYATLLNGGTELKNTVTTPLGHKTEHYFSVFVDFPTPPWDIHEYGLPLTHNATDATGTRFLSSREYGTGNVLLRSTYVRYERDAGVFVETAEATKLNQRLASSRTVYEDDTVAGSPQGGKRFADMDYSDFDGLGHYRTSQTNGNFAADNVRTWYTRYNAARGSYPGPYSPWPTTTPWILNTFDLADASTPTATARRTFVVDSTNGWVSRTRTHGSDTGAEASNDIIVETIQDGHGNLQSERYYGGDLQAVGTGALASLGLPPPQYRIDSTTQYGTRATATYVDGAGTPLSFKTLDQTIDATGLVSASRDTSGISTAYDYDAMGRLRWSKPETGHDGWTEYAYTRATSPAALAQVNVYRRPNGGGTPLAESLVKYDAFGRVWQEQQKMPNGTWSTRETLYNAMGWKSSVSELGNTAKKTQYLGYDRYGRPATVRPPDGSGHDVSFSYTGVRSVGRSVKVGTTYNAGVVSEASAWTTEIYNRQGLLYQVREEAEANSTNTITTYTYDAGKRLRQVNQQTSAGTQNRWFTYDNRGFLLSEQHPEKGATGNGLVYFRNYDPLGHAGRRYECSGASCTDRTADLSFVYDRAGRLTTVTDVTVPSTPKTLKTFAYGTSNAAGVRSNGRLETASRYNYVGAPFDATVRVVETYTYGGRQGRISRKNVQTVLNGTNTHSFVQSYTYDELGKVRRINYPECTYLTDCTSPVPRAVEFTYANGMLTAVPGFATSITYHPNGIYSQITHANGVVDTQSNDPNGMARPAAIASSRPGSTMWSSGAYAYDGAGNVKRMGNGYFLYDHVNRLIDGRIDDNPTGGGTLRWQTYTYDPFGNLTNVGGDPWAAGRSTPTSATSNRLTTATFDVAGNMRSWNGNSYEYDALGMMTRMVAGAEDWRYLYTAADERFWSYRVGGGGSTHFLRDLDGKVLRQYYDHTSWMAVRDYVYRDGQLLASEGTQAQSSFSDVPPSHRYSAEIEAMKASGITAGCGAGVYCPDNYVNRAQMAIFLIRGMGITPPTCQLPVFNDVPCSYWAADWINELWRQGITGGCGGGSYCPEDPVTPAQMAVFMTSATTPGYDPPACLQWQTRAFSDVAWDHWACKFIEEMNRRGIDNGCGGGNFCPESSLTRGVMSPLLARGFSLPYPDKGYTKHYSLDHLGTPRLISSNASSRLAHHAYFPFGEELTSFSQDAERMKFTGHERDFANPSGVADDLDYMHARHYNPLTGRFLSVDGARGLRTRPQTWNRHAYVIGNPLKYIDPDGLWFQGPWQAQRWALLWAYAFHDTIDACYICAGSDTGLAGLNSLIAGRGFQDSLFGDEGTREIGARVAGMAGPPVKAVGIGLMGFFLVQPFIAPLEAGGMTFAETLHGAERLSDASRLSTMEAVIAERGAQVVLEQADGAVVYIQQVEPGKFNVVVKGTRGIITNFRNLSESSLARLASRYGWH